MNTFNSNDGAECSTTSIVHQRHHEKQRLEVEDSASDKKQLAIEENDDWLATCAIYGEESTSVEPLPQGFYGCLCITMSTEYTAFFRSIHGKEGKFRFFSLAQQPKLSLKFKYHLTDDQTDFEDLRSTRPSSVTIQWSLYPEEWPDDFKRPFLAQIWEESNRILQEQELSYDVCEYCEHNALLDYSPWPSFHQEDPFRMLRLPPVIDSLYHTNYGTLIDVRMEARMVPSSSTGGSTAITIPTKNLSTDIHNAKRLVNRKRPPTVEAYARQALIDEWKQLYTTECPVCFDTMTYAEGVILPCHHFVCRDCLSNLLHFKVKELSMYRTNPFACPELDCRHSLPIIGFVKKFIPTNEMDLIRKWIKDMKYPPCFSLDRCLHTKTCGAFESMRRVSKDSTHIFCDQCNKHWCELCLKRLDEDGADNKGDNHKDRCQDTIAWTFCKRYLAASDNQKQACEAKYPWIVSYAHAREHDGDAMKWILQNGQVCPNCSTGVERIEGCFHMQCPTCSTHFCYECGDELFPPYYGTHHCWERTQLQL